MKPEPARAPSGAESATTPRIAVIVPTRNRPDHTEPCVRSILANPERDVEFVLVDQSDDDASESAVVAHRCDPRFRYVRSATRGASNARNVGIQASTAPIVAFTDDDCRVAVNWMARVGEIFEPDPAADVIFGRVSIPAELRLRGAERTSSPTSASTRVVSLPPTWRGASGLT
jgi:glycosyltransferase involved in cell wall biosynthesis